MVHHRLQGMVEGDNDTGFLLVNLGNCGEVELLILFGTGRHILENRDLENKFQTEI